MGYDCGRKQDEGGLLARDHGGMTSGFSFAPIISSPLGAAGTEKRVRYGSDTVAGAPLGACAVKGLTSRGKGKLIGARYGER
jgi:hypothetical protein